MKSIPPPRARRTFVGGAHAGEGMTIKYIGSKRLILPHINAAVQSLDPKCKRSVLDIFTGSTRVAQSIKRTGRVTYANDHNAHSALIAKCYMECDPGSREAAEAQSVIDELNTLNGKHGWFTKTYCEDSRFFKPKNGQKIDAIRDRIERMELDPIVRAVVLTSLIEAADRVDSTVGIQMAYVKQWAKRADKDIMLVMPELIYGGDGTGKCKAYQMDADDAANDIDADIVYLDPPYNGKKYRSYYHIWESLVLWDKPEVYGVAKKRVDVNDEDTSFYYKKDAKISLFSLLSSLSDKDVILSYSDEGFVDIDEIVFHMKVLYSEVEVREIPHPRHISSKLVNDYLKSGKKPKRQLVEYLIVGKKK